MNLVRRVLVREAVAVCGVTGCLVAASCGGDGESTDTPPPPLPTIDIPSIATPAQSIAGTVNMGSFCQEYRAVEQGFEQATADSLQDARARLNEVVDQVEALAADVPPELSGDFEVILGGFQQIAALADQATSLEELQAAVVDLDPATFDEAGRAIEEWAQANC